MNEPNHLTNTKLEPDLTTHRSQQQVTRKQQKAQQTNERQFTHYTADEARQAT